MVNKDCSHTLVNNKSMITFRTIARVSVDVNYLALEFDFTDKILLF